MQSADFIKALFEFVVLIFSLCFHEAAHAWTASRLGDQTARLQGRVTLNPMYHVDPVGTLLIPAMMIFGPLMGGGAFSGFLIGWAKPTPVITRNFRNIKRDDMLTTLAGPFSNLLLAFFAFVGLAFLVRFQGSLPMDKFGPHVEGFGMICEMALFVNLALFFFNLLPIPPLDGSHVVRNILPYNWLTHYDKLGWFGVILMLLIGGPIVRFFMAPTLQIAGALLAGMQGH